MTTRIVINEKEITNPIVKLGLAFGLILMASLLSVIIVFVILPVIGIVITLSFGIAAVFLATLIAGITTLVLSSTVFGWLFGSTHFSFEKTHKKK